MSGFSGVQKPGSGTSHARRRAAHVSFFESGSRCARTSNASPTNRKMEQCLWARTFLRAWVCRLWRRPNESKCHESRCKCQWHPGWSWLCLFVTHSYLQPSAESDLEGLRSDPRSRAFSKKRFLSSTLSPSSRRPTNGTMSVHHVCPLCSVKSMTVFRENKTIRIHCHPEPG